MELFRDDGCLTDEGFRTMMAGQLDELGRLETAEHLSYCDKCMDRYTALLTADVLEPAPHSLRGVVMGGIWVRLMQNTYGRAAVAGVAAVLALTMWRSGALNQITQYSGQWENMVAQSQTYESEQDTLPYQPIEDTRPAQQELTGKPAQTSLDRRYEPAKSEKTEKTSLLRKLLSGIAKPDTDTTQNTEK